MNRNCSVRIPQDLLNGDSAGTKIFFSIDGFLSRLFFAFFFKHHDKIH